MPRLARYLTHPQVHIDATVDVGSWSLNETGAARVAALVQNLGVLRDTRHVFSSEETKALETATPLAAALDLPVQVRPGMHENDRSATGFLPPDEFERVADRFFAEPLTSVRGWETAADAQRRILKATLSCLAEAGEGDVLFVGHGAVGTLLFCALAGHGIDRRFDQGPNGGGCWFDFDIDDPVPRHGWRPMESLSAKGGA
ncbi:histidine phosphatase family protein [Falsirhodobacter sp. 1013]|uniref:histidine phosphatase family protein n=1 Tax=Falsirhodobacter sp. 1013 TaxID=3417566 RepID=UPI003EB82D27